MQDINLDLDKENELIFKLSVEGTKPATVKNRLMLETNNFSLVFPAKSLPDGDISISIPPLENIIPEGRYVGSLEVIIDDKVFTPIQIQTDFKKSVNVVAEVVTREPAGPRVSVSSVVSVNKKSHEPDVPKDIHTEVVQDSKPIETEKRPETEKILEHVSTGKASRPPQRTGKRPARGKKEKAAATLLESKIRKIAEKKNIKISERQISEIVNYMKVVKK